MSVRQPLTGDPWASSDNPLGSKAPQPTVLTRADLAELAARALLEYPAEHEWTEEDLAPITTIGPESHASLHIELARDVLDAAYPQVSTEAEIAALNWMAVIVNDHGHVYQRDISPTNHLDYGGKPWSHPGGVSGRHRVGQRSATLVASGPWTVVHRGQP